MTLWIHGKPRKPFPHAVCFVDYDNLYIMRDRPFNPVYSEYRQLELVRGLLTDICSVEPETWIFTNVNRRSDVERAALEDVSKQQQVPIVHCPTRNGEDRVDSWIIRQMRARHKREASNVAFLLISVDSDFAPLCRELRADRRYIYIGAPPESIMPIHIRPGTKVCSGSAWVDPGTNFHRAMYFLLQQERDLSPFEQYIHGRNGFCQEFPAFTLLRAQVKHLARRIADHGPFVFPSGNEAVAWIIDAISRYSRIPAPNTFQASGLLTNMVHYGFMLSQNGQIITNMAHPRVILSRRDIQNYEQRTQPRLIRSGHLRL
ncbi:MAG: NYN domain-containing protein, partial [Patescibacteria group bacterium]